MSKVIEEAIGNLPLVYAKHSPGDGVTRYRFFLETWPQTGYHASYNSGNGIHTALGVKSALAFIKAFGLGYHAGSHSEIYGLRTIEVDK